MKRSRALLLACSLLLAVPVLSAQAPDRGAGGPGGPEGADGPPHPRMGHHGMGIVPPGTWWKNANTIQQLNLSADQQKRLDDIFLQSRIQLVQRHASLQQEQLKLEPLLNANPVDQTRALEQISRIADMRAELEKADARMLLGLRSVLNAEQWTKLQADSHRRMGDPGSPHGFRHSPGESPEGTPPPPPGANGPAE